MMKEVFECQNRYFKTKPRLVKRNATLVPPTGNRIFVEICNCLTASVYLSYFSF